MTLPQNKVSLSSSNVPHPARKLTMFPLINDLLPQDFGLASVLFKSDICLFTPTFNLLPGGTIKMKSENR